MNTTRIARLNKISEEDLRLMALFLKLTAERNRRNPKKNLDEL